MTVTLDYIYPIQLADSDKRKRFNEIRSLDYLRVGLHRLYNEVSTIERERKARLREANLQVVSFGQHSLEQRLHEDKICCYFHWYANSLCNYVRLIGWIGHEADSSLPVPRMYAEEVIRDVLVWRNKVAAHFAMTDPRKDDSKATLKASVSYPLVSENGVYYVSGLILFVKDAGESTRSNLPKWSLTKVHERLAARYWPAQEVPDDDENLPSTSATDDEVHL